MWRHRTCSITLNLYHICSETENNVVNSVFSEENRAFVGLHLLRIHSAAVSWLSNESICRTHTGLIVFQAHICIYLFIFNPGGSLGVSCQVHMNQNLINDRKQQSDKGKFLL